MRRIRSHVDLELQAGELVALPADSRTHLLRVLRLRDGDAITLFNGDGHDYPARLVGSGPETSAKILAKEPAAAAETRLSITLVQALARGEKMDWIIQKATELGVREIMPVTSQRSEVRLSGDRAERRLVHWRQVAISACEQCGRARVPKIVAPTALHEVAASNTAALRLLLDPGAAGAPRDLDLAFEDFAIAIGPEGGFDAPELDMMRRCGWQGLRLGARVLRTETAGIAAIAALLALAGDL